MMTSIFYKLKTWALIAPLICFFGIPSAYLAQLDSTESADRITRTSSSNINRHSTLAKPIDLSFLAASDRAATHAHPKPELFFEAPDIEGSDYLLRPRFRSTFSFANSKFQVVSFASKLEEIDRLTSAILSLTGEVAQFSRKSKSQIGAEIFMAASIPPPTRV